MKCSLAKMCLFFLQACFLVLIVGVTQRQLVIAANILEEEEARIKQEHVLVDNAILERQRISDSNTFQANGNIYSLNDLQPYHVYAHGATLTQDGQAMSILDNTGAAGHLFVATGEQGETIFVTKRRVDGSSDEIIKAIDILYLDGSEIYLQALSNGDLVTIRPQDRDNAKLQEFTLGGITGDEDEMVFDQYFEGFGGRQRELQQTCSSYQVIQVAIAYDSTFCSFVAGGSSTQATSLVEEIVARTSLLYQQICVKVTLTHVEGFCSSSSDPYQQAINTNNIGCGSNFGALQSFRNYWVTNRQDVQRDTAHLFYGTNFPGGSIGCASLSALCNAAAYGVNQMTFTGSLLFRSNLFSHELGHNAGAPHASSQAGEFLMEPVINSVSNGFTENTIDFIKSYLNSKSCISVEEDDDGPAPTNPPGGCFTGGQWTDSAGYSCRWYESNEPFGCPTWGFYPGSGGLTAGQACCHCQGLSTPAPTPMPTPTPNIGECATGNAWIDASGASCRWYETNEPPGCPNWSWYPGNDGMSTAGDACCHCTEMCAQADGWIDNAGTTCEWYETNEPKGCPTWSWYPGSGGLTAGEACCHCMCENLVGWIDNAGYKCDWYENFEQAGCPTWADYPGSNPGGVFTAGEACCHCRS